MDPTALLNGWNVNPEETDLRIREGQALLNWQIAMARWADKPASVDLIQDVLQQFDAYLDCRTAVHNHRDAAERAKLIKTLRIGADAAALLGPFSKGLDNIAGDLEAVRRALSPNKGDSK